MGHKLYKNKSINDLKHTVHLFMLRTYFFYLIFRRISVECMFLDNATKCKNLYSNFINCNDDSCRNEIKENYLFYRLFLALDAK